MNTLVSDKPVPTPYTDIPWPGASHGVAARHAGQKVCQLMSRPRYARLVKCTGPEAVTEMVCAILAELAEVMEVPNALLAKKLDVPASRITGMFVYGVWPKKTLDVLQTFEHLVRWMILGSPTKDPTALLKDTATAAEKKEAERDADEETTKREACDQIIEYFFPQEKRGIDRIPPYFLPARREWAGPYDRREFGLAVNWLRRQANFEGYRGLLAFVISSERAADALFDNELRRKVAFAMRAKPKNMTVAIVYPDDQKRIEDTLRAKLADSTEKFDDVNGDPRADYIPTERSRALSLFNGLVAFAVLAYLDPEHSVAQSRLFILRPFDSSISTMPFAIEASKPEKLEFTTTLRKAGLNADLDNLILERYQPASFEI